MYTFELLPYVLWENLLQKIVETSYAFLLLLHSNEPIFLFIFVLWIRRGTFREPLCQFPAGGIVQAAPYHQGLVIRSIVCVKQRYAFLKTSVSHP